MHIANISELLVAFGMGATCGTLSGGTVADRFGPKRPLLISLLTLMIIELVLALVTTTWVGGLPLLFVFGMLTSVLFIPQQHRLLSLEPDHTNVILALNNSTFYLGIAGGAALGGLALREVGVTQLGWIGAACVLLALVLFTFSVRLGEYKRQEKS